MNSILQVFFYSVFSGFLLSCAIPNELLLLGCPVISFVAIIPYYKAIQKCKSYRMAFWSGFIQTLTTHLISSYWLAFFKDFAIFTLGGSALATAILGGLAGLLAYLPYSLNKKHNLSFQQLHKKFYQSSNFRIFYFTIVYILYEYIKSSGFLGYPWGTVSSTMFKFPLIMQIASITGTYGITFLVVLANAIFAEVIGLFNKKNLIYSEIHKKHRYAEIKQIFIFYAVLMATSLVYGAFQYNIVRNPIKQITSILIQPNLNSWDNYDDDENILVMENLTREQAEILKKVDKKPQLIVWSEGALLKAFSDYNVSFYKHTPRENPLVSFIREMDSPFISGGSYVEINFDEEQDDFFSNYYNAALMFNPQGELKGYYGKIHLVPFAELIPGMDNPVIYKFLSRKIGISAGWTPGKKLTYFNIPATSLIDSENALVHDITIDSWNKTEEQQENKLTTAKISTPICFDDAFTDTMRFLYLNGSEVFFNISDDSWSLKKSSEYQHFVIAAYRAIEYRTTLVRTTNAGYTVVVDPAGKILADLPLYEEAALTYDVPVYKRQFTTYAAFGNWFPICCIIFVFITVIFSFITFTPTDYIPSEKKRKIQNSKSKK